MEDAEKVPICVPVSHSPWKFVVVFRVPNSKKKVESKKVFVAYAIEETTPSPKLPTARLCEKVRVCSAPSDACGWNFFNKPPTTILLGRYRWAHKVRFSLSPRRCFVAAAWQALGRA